MNNITILAVRGHGKNTAGKRSLIRKDGTRLYEWDFARRIVGFMIEYGKEYGVKVENIVPEDKDVSLTTRYTRANAYIKAHRNERCVLFDVHGNAAGNGKSWTTATGWECWTTKGQNNSDKLAERLYDAVKAEFPEWTFRTDKADGDRDKENNWSVIYGANCPAVLSENGFYDNEKECELMATEEFQRKIAKAHVIAALKYYGK